MSAISAAFYFALQFGIMLLGLVLFATGVVLLLKLKNKLPVARPSLLGRYLVRYLYPSCWLWRLLRASAVKIRALDKVEILEV